MKNSNARQAAPQVIPFPRPTSPPKVDFPFIMVPDAVAADRQLSQGAKMLFGVILTYARRGHCYAGNETLAARAGMSKIQARRLLKILEGRGLIIRDMRGKAREEIRVPMLCIKKMHGMDQDDARVCIIGSVPPESKGCTSTESLESQDSDSLPPDEEIDPHTRRWFGHLIGGCT
jgi:hypothetical protein